MQPQIECGQCTASDQGARRMVKAGGRTTENESAYGRRGPRVRCCSAVVNIHVWIISEMRHLVPGKMTHPRRWSYIVVDTGSSRVAYIRKSSPSWFTIGLFRLSKLPKLGLSHLWLSTLRSHYSLVRARVTAKGHSRVAVSDRGTTFEPLFSVWRLAFRPPPTPRPPPPLLAHPSLPRICYTFQSRATSLISHNEQRPRQEARPHRKRPWRNTSWWGWSRLSTTARRSWTGDHSICGSPFLRALCFREIAIRPRPYPFSFALTTPGSSTPQWMSSCWRLELSSRVSRIRHAPFPSCSTRHSHHSPLD